MKFFKLNIFIITVIFIVANTICAGIGMGVPILNIFLGFFTGWYAYIRLFNLYDVPKTVLKKTFFYNLFCAGYTFLIMAVIWGQMFVRLFDKNADFANFGHPMILYDPKISFIGWMVLMMFISPFLQLLTSVFSTYLTLMFYKKNRSGNPEK